MTLKDAIRLETAATAAQAIRINIVRIHPARARTISRDKDFTKL
jgi:hypothetical protein